MSECLFFLSASLPRRSRFVVVDISRTVKKSDGGDSQLLKRTCMLGSVQKLRNLMKRELLIYGRLQRPLPWIIPVLRFSLLQNE